MQWSSMHNECNGHQCTMNAMVINAQSMQWSSMHNQCNGHQCTMNAMVINAQSMQWSSMHNQCNGHECTMNAMVTMHNESGLAKIIIFLKKNQKIGFFYLTRIFFI